jgi:short-subunit dehydrogenase
MEKGNKWIVVTGGTKGIGRAIVEAFICEGFNAIICARSEADLAEMKRMLASQFPSQQLLIYTADLSKKIESKAFAEFVNNKVAHFDVLVNNAGFFQAGQIHNEKDGVLESMIETNLYSAYHVTRALLPKLMSAKSGHVFNLCSIASIMPYENGGSYTISKYALLGMTKVLREEMKPFGVRVTAVLPGATLTESWKGVDLPKERFMQPEDVGQAVLSCWKLSKHTVVEELLLRPQLGDI